MNTHTIKVPGAALAFPRIMSDAQAYWSEAPEDERPSYETLLQAITAALEDAAAAHGFTYYRPRWSEGGIPAGTEVDLGAFEEDALARAAAAVENARTT